jgi:hypothetical protein
MRFNPGCIRTERTNLLAVFYTSDNLIERGEQIIGVFFSRFILYCKFSKF